MEFKALDALKISAAFFILMLCRHSIASQFGPVLPTHHFPTTESLHVGYSLGFANTGSNFLDATSTEPLTQDASLRIISHKITAEVQPNPKLSFGAHISINQLTLGDPHSGLSVGNSGLGDQRLWGEFRFIDVVGSSLGLAIITKFPGYKNPTSQDLLTQGVDSVALLGDAQTDFSVLLTAEHWINKTVRARFDFGATMRTEGYSSEVPFQLALGFVNQKMDFDIRLKGNLTLGNDSLGQASNTPQGISELRKAFAGSAFALAQNPWIFTVNPYLELWTSPKHAITFEYQYSWMGARAPQYHYFGIGMTMRWAKNKFYRPNQYQKVDMSTVQDPEKFQGEMGEEDAGPKVKEDGPGREVEDGDEEFK